MKIQFWIPQCTELYVRASLRLEADLQSVASSAILTIMVILYVQCSVYTFVDTSAGEEWTTWGDVCQFFIDTLPAMLLWRIIWSFTQYILAMLSLEASIRFLKIALSLRNYSTLLLLLFIQFYLCWYWER